MWKKELLFGECEVIERCDLEGLTRDFREVNKEDRIREENAGARLIMLVQEFGIPFPMDTIQRQLTINIK